MGFRKILASKSHHSCHHSQPHKNLKLQNHRYVLISNITGSHETKYLSPFRMDNCSGSRRRDRLHVKLKSLRNKIHKQLHPNCRFDDATKTSDDKCVSYEVPEKDGLATISLEEVFPKSNRCQIPEENLGETDSVIHRDLGNFANENDYPQWRKVESQYNLENVQPEEDKIVDRLRSEIRSTKLKSVKTTSRTLEKAIEARCTGKRVLQQLSCQSNQLTKIESNCDMLKIQSNVADRKIDKLAHENRSLLALKSPNPFRKKREREKRDQINNLKLKHCHLQQETMKRAQDSDKNLAINLSSEYGRYGQGVERQRILRDAQKYQFEADEEDNQMEIDLYGNLEQIKAVSGDLKIMAYTFGREFEAQNTRMFDIENNVQQADNTLQAKRYRLEKVIGKRW
ncbi:CQS_1a_G0009630.mRNA.1.CDS.1 [Saccharomyces cerevisiae]|nr:CQS_1a_G0009630.mRNA.1.CDS.1 [Saccharomyces cerevisiae]CAI7198892.1 CQS_1a_G0009630.mRNA.1.CDS.1 [Saccharomyces cerevisiae]